MGTHCCGTGDHQPQDPIYRRVLWIVMVVNGVMCVTEWTAGWLARSVALQADALDFLGDTATYAITLLVLGYGPRMRSGAGLLKGLSLVVFGLWVMAETAGRLYEPALPKAPTMSGIGTLALAANLLCAALLYRFRNGDSNMRSVWLCSRNDAIANIAVIGAALAVWSSGTQWPDLAVGFAIAALALHAGWSILRQAAGELGLRAVEP